MNSCDSEVFPGFVFSITWHSKLVDSHCRCESREENLFWEADYYIIAVACSGQSLSLFSCLLSYMIYSTPADCKYKHSVVDGILYFTHRNTDYVIKPLLFLGL